MIYDCFTFFNELEMLEIRLNILKDVVDKFVLVEMPVTHIGKPKPLYYEENKERFKEFHDKIIHIIVNDYPSIENSKTGADGNKWILENFQRDRILDGLKDAKDDDIVIISDLDEIPNPEVIKNYKKDGAKTLVQKLYSYYLNNREIGTFTRTAKIGCYSDLLDPKFELPSHHFIEYSQYGYPTYFRWCVCEEIQNGGWHFSYIGNFDLIYEKINSIVEGPLLLENSKMNKDEVKNAYLENKDIYGRNIDYEPETIDLSFPKYIIENQRKYKHLIKPITDTDRVNKLEREISELKKYLAYQNSLIQKLIKDLNEIKK